MAESISLTVSATVAGGPKLVDVRTLEVEAYEKITVSVPNDSSDVQVELQPGGVGEVKLIMITSDAYGSDLTYSADGGTTTIALDQPQLFVGTGAVGVLGTPQSIVLNNGLAEPSAAEIEILIGRDASAPAP